MNKRVVITGLGVIAPNGTGIPSFTNAIKLGKSGINYIEELAQYNFSCQVGGIPDISESVFFHFLEKYSLTDADAAIKYAVLAGLEAWTDAGFEIPDFFNDNTNDDTGCIIGTGLGGTDIFVRKVFPFVNSGNSRRLGSQIVEHWMPSGSAASLAKILALANQTTSISSACSTGTEAIIQGFKRIQSGDAKAMLVGSTDPYSLYCWAGFDAMKVLCRKFNETPAKASRPMSETAAGFVPGAGAGVLFIENLETALKRNAKIYAEIIGTSINSGGQRNGGSMTAPNSKNVIKCIKNALLEAEIEGNQIDLISGHLTGTMGDSIEIKNWVEALNLSDKFPYVNSLKSMIGHLIAASGAVESIAAILQLKYDFIHPSINCEDLNPEIEKIFPRKNIPQTYIEHTGIKHIAKASFGFGDVNSCIILKKYS